MKKQEQGFEKKLSKMQEKLTVVTCENQKLQMRLDSTQDKLRNAHSNSLDVVSLPIKKDLRELIEKQTKTILWSMVKFIQSPQEEIMAARMLVACAHGLPEENIATKADKEATAHTYKTYIRKAIFQRRNYVAAEHKKVMMKRFKDKGSMPTVHQLVKCLTRDIAQDEDFEIFEFYWDELLTKQVGSCIWSKEVRRYKTICEAVRKEHSHKRLPMITPEDEAFTVLVIENSYDRWLKEIAEEKDGSLQEMKKKRPANYYNGLYTLTDSGQNEWGGWKVEGLELFNKYVDMNRAARKERTTPAVEAACLQRLKKKHNIVCNDHKTQADLNRKRKRKRADDTGVTNKPKTLFTIRPEFHDLFLDGGGTATDDSTTSSEASSEDGEEDEDGDHESDSLCVPAHGKQPLP